MTLVNIDLRNQGYETGTDDRVIFYSLLVREGDFGTISTAPVEVELVDGKATVDLAPGPVGVQIIAGQVADTRVREGRVPMEGPTTLNVVLTLLPEYSDAVRASFLAAIRGAQDEALTRIDAEVAAAVDSEVGEFKTKAEQALTKSTAAELSAGNAVSRVGALETMNGLAPGEPADGQTANLVSQPDTLTRKALDVTYQPTGEYADAQTVNDLESRKLDKAEAESTYATADNVSEIVSPLVPPLVADAIASDDAPAQAAAAAVQSFMAGHSRASATIDGLMPAPDKAKLDAATVISSPETIVMRDAEGSIAVPAPTQAHHPVRKDRMDLEIGRVHQPYRVLTGDLNTVTTSGLHEQSSNANATLELNYPISAAGMLRVSTSPNGRSWQEYQTFGFGANGNRTFRRALYTGEWTPWQEMVRADQIPDSGEGVDMAALDTRFAPSGVVARTQREDEIRRGKGGTIGTAGKGVISFREDHKTDEWLSVVWPLLRERDIPASFGVVSGSIGNPTAAYEPTNATWDDLKQMFKEGVEIWDHSLHHSDPKPGQTFVDILTGSRDAIEAQGLRVAGFQQPGAPATYGAGHTTVDAMQDEAGRTIQATYGLFESSLLGTNRRVLPTNGARGHDHVTIDSLPLSSIKSLVDEAAGRKLGIQMMLHADVVGKPGYISLADLTEALDYIAAARDEGRIEVLTASGLAFADPNVSHRFDWVAVPEFTTATTSPRPYGWAESSAGTFTVEDGLLTIPATKTLAYTTGQMRNLGLDGHVFMLDAEVRAPDADATVHLRMTELGGAAQLFREKHIPITAGAEFTRVRMPVGVPKGIVSAALWVGRSGGGRVQFKNVHLYAG